MTETPRITYLIEYRNGLWTQIRSKEDSVWRFISFYAAAIVLIAGFLKPEDPSKQILTPISMLFIILTVIIVSFWGILITLDANFWMQRNLVIVGNIERELLADKDFGVVLPKNYVYPGYYKYSRSYYIQLIFFSLTMCIAIFAYISFAVGNHGSKSEFIFAMSQIIPLTFCILLLYTIHRNRNWIEEYGKFCIDAPGKDIDKRIPFLQGINRAKAFWTSGFEYLLSFFSVFGSFCFIFAAMLVQSKYDYFSYVGYGMIFGCGLIITFIFLFRLSEQKNIKKIITDIDNETTDKTTDETLPNNRQYKKIESWQRIIYYFQIAIIFISIVVSSEAITEVVLLKLPSFFK